MDPNPYDNYYSIQVGSGLPVYHGIRFQRGSGLFSRLFIDKVFPFFKDLFPAIGKRVLPTVATFGKDIIAGENFKDTALKSLKTIGRDVADETLEQLKNRLQKGSGTISRKRKKVNKKRLKNTKRKHKTFDFLK
jgi:hypothetical protein